MNTVLISILVFILGFIIGSLVMIGIRNLKIKKDTEKATNIIEQAKKDAEKTKRESIVETKQEIHKLKLDADKEIKEKKI